MAGKIVSVLFNFLINLIATVIQLVVWPLNQVLSATLPDISDKIISVGTGISNLMQALPWALSILPLSFISVMIFCWSTRLVVQNLHISTKTIIKVWNVLQKIKFW